MKHYDLVALQETWLFPWDLAVPSTLRVDVNSFSLSCINLMSLMGSSQDVQMKEKDSYGIEILAATFKCRGMSWIGFLD